MAAERMLVAWMLAERMAEWMAEWMRESTAALAALADSGR